MRPNLANKENLLLITVDHWPAALWQGPESQAVRLPNLRLLQQVGSAWHHAYAETPVCIPARRTLHSGLSPLQHGVHHYQPGIPLPEGPTLASTLRDAGYQTGCVGKLHLDPFRFRAGFEEQRLHEEGRTWPQPDDYDNYLSEMGFPWQQFGHGASNNHYNARPWHLPDFTHPIVWSGREMVRMIRRRDPTCPAFWYLSFAQPHPPLAPIRDYWELYRQSTPSARVRSPWDADGARMPSYLESIQARYQLLTGEEITDALQAFYALCTMIDTQIGLVIAALREEGLLSRTTILFLSDHGDMLGHHGLWAKNTFFDYSCRIPFLLVPSPRQAERWKTCDPYKVVGLVDVMPTLLEIAEIPPQRELVGISALSPTARPYLYGVLGGREQHETSRMIVTRTHKLIFYPHDGRFFLFHLEKDPLETQDLWDSPAGADEAARLWGWLQHEIQAEGCPWLSDRIRNHTKPEPRPSDQSFQRTLGLQRSIR